MARPEPAGQQRARSRRAFPKYVVVLSSSRLDGWREHTKLTKPDTHLYRRAKDGVGPIGELNRDLMKDSPWYKDLVPDVRSSKPNHSLCPQ
jgi:hypothetical protein